MDREMINEQDLGAVVGGTIMFSSDHTTCGRNKTGQYKVLNFSAAIKYINEHRLEENEKTMLQKMAAAGILSKL